jgi:serine protease Do
MTENTWNHDENQLGASPYSADGGDTTSDIEAVASDMAAELLDGQSDTENTPGESQIQLEEVSSEKAQDVHGVAPVPMLTSETAQPSEDRASAPVSLPKTSRGRFKHLLAGFLAGILFTTCVSAASIGGFLALSRGEFSWNQTTQTAQAISESTAETLTQLPAQSNGSTGSGKAVTAAVGTGTLTIPEIAEKMKNSVVGISTESIYGTATGTGIIYSSDGTIITNAHVISGGRNITVTMPDGTTYDATVVGSDAKSDLAVIKISAKGLPAATFGNSNNLVVGETAVAIGNPLGLEFAGSVTAGVISALNREVDVDGRYMTMIQTDAAINPGNSGGPLLNNKGEVVGINSVKVSSSDAEGLGFAIPISDALPIIQELISNGHVTGRPSIGISGEELSAQAASYYNVPQGFLVRTVTSGSGAEAGGLQAGDIITAFNGINVKTQSELNREKDRCKAGDTVTIKVYRTTNDKALELNIVLSEAVG